VAAAQQGTKWWLAASAAGTALLVVFFSNVPPVSQGASRASFRYGQRVMKQTLYFGMDRGDDVETICRAAMGNPVRPPVEFDRSAGQSGCIAEKAIIDSAFV
jgi:hypothetical protein